MHFLSAYCKKKKNASNQPRKQGKGIRSLLTTMRWGSGDKIWAAVAEESLGLYMAPADIPSWQGSGTKEFICNRILLKKCPW